MQTFRVVLEVTANTIESVTAENIRKAIEPLLEDYDGGPTPEIIEVYEVGA